MVGVSSKTVPSLEVPPFRWCHRACHPFFLQAEDGIRDYKVTGVQTCALPIYERLLTYSTSKVGWAYNTWKEQLLPLVACLSRSASLPTASSRIAERLNISISKDL